MAKYKITITKLYGWGEDINLNVDSFLLHYKPEDEDNLNFIGEGFGKEELGDSLKQTINFIVKECMD